MSEADKRMRADEIDGLRGWAAVVVLLFHVFHETFGAVLPWTKNPLVFSVINGPLAVFVFFVLSGDALSIGYVRTRQRSSLDSLAVRRYTRLTIPIALSCFVLFVLVLSGANHNKAAGQRVASEWLASFLDFQPTITGYLRYVLIEVYSPAKVYGAPLQQYNPMLWTMPVELGGSALVLLFWYLSPGLRRPMAVLMAAALALAALGSYYSLFFFGMIFAQWRSAGVFDRFRIARRWQWLAPLLFLAAVVGHGHLGNQAGMRHVSIVCAVLIVFSVYTSIPLLRIFRSAPSRFVGEISFPLYLTHLAVLVSFTSWCIVSTGAITSILAIQIGTASIVVAVVVAMIFREIERGALRTVDSRLIRLVLPSTKQASMAAERGSARAPQPD